MSTPEDNIKILLADWLDGLRRQDLDAIEQRMAPEVFWQGIREEFVCVDREEAMSLLREQQREDYGVEALELVGTEEKVVLGVRSTQLREVGGVALGARSSKSSRCTRASSSGWTSTSDAAMRWRPRMPKAWEAGGNAIWAGSEPDTRPARFQFTLVRGETV